MLNIRGVFRRAMDALHSVGIQDGNTFSNNFAESGGALDVRMTSSVL